MAGPINISIEPTRKLSTTAELRLLREAVYQNWHSQSVRLRLARLLNKLDAFSETIELLTEDLDANVNLGAKFALITAYFSRDVADDNVRAQSVIEDALALELNDSERSHLLADLAKAHLRLNQNDEAVALLWRALELDPTNVNAFKRLALELLHQKQPLQVIALTNQLKKQNIGHSRLLAARVLALAASSECKSAEELAGISQFVYAGLIQAPSGWLDLAAFNAALALEISNNPDLRFGRYGTSSEKAWRVDHPATGNTPAVTALLTEIARIAQVHAASFAEQVHSWLDAKPLKAQLRSWCVMTEGDGFEKWHMHPEGWMSGGYYVDVPDTVVNGSGEEGCLTLGLPDGLIGEAAAQSVQRRLIRPKPGLLTLFPSHAYHRTFPHNGQGRRMCIAFDVCPVRI
jgi:uncharacterized protein (TIGR02466 family)